VQKGHVAMAGICLTAVAMPVFADAASEQNAVLPLDTVTVSVNRVPESLKNVAPNVAAISRDDLDKKGADDLAKMFKGEPGISVPGETQRRGSSGVNIRGIDGNRILMLVDGERLPEGYESSGRGYIASRDYIEPDTLKQIEVIKGPASALYGSDAIGGVVSYRTFNPNDFVDALKPTYFSLKESYDGATKGWGTTATVAAAGDQIAAMLMVTQRRAHEQENQGSVGGTGSKRTISDPQTTTTQNVLAKVTLGQTGPHKVILSAEQFERKRNTSLLADSSWTSATKSYDSHDEVGRTKVAAEYQYTGGGTLASADLKIYEQKLKDKDRDTKVTSSSSTYNNNYFDQTIDGIDGQMNWKFGRQDIVAGVELTRTRTARQTAATTATSSSSSTSYSEYFPDSTSERIGIFVQDSIALGGATLTPALRYDHYRLTPHTDSVFSATSSSSSLSTFNDGAWSPKLGLSLPLADGVTGFANLNTGFRAPPFDSAFMARTANYGSASYKIIQNPNLKSETSRGVETGAKYAGDSVQAQLTAYYNRYHNFIETANLGQSGGYTIYQYQNVTQVQIYGVEAKTGWNVLPGVRLTASLAWTQGKNLTSNKPLNSVDPLRAVFGAGYSRDQWGSDVTWTLVKRKTSIDSSTSANLFQTPGYGVVDLGGWYKINRNATVRLGLNNVFDKKYWQWSVVNSSYAIGAARDLYSEPRRNLTASIEVAF
jgi:hemoglobin/transferrin/lactoferrin receptor protein